MSDAPCPSEDTLLAFVGGYLGPDDTRLVEAHVDACPPCRTLLAEAGRELSQSHDEAEADHVVTAPRIVRGPGNKVGRYQLLEVLGRGAMGTVYAAYDPDLDRKVAVKIVSVRPQPGVSASEIEARSMREAQAMARLQHENVVAVHDIGSVEGGVYLAMELVSGDTLGAWLRAEPRGWRDVVAMFLQAGDGLAAAHAAGIVHRDFKPDNVLVDAAGVAHVTDFGLARVSVRDFAPSEAPELSSDLLRTRAGSVIGTPAYMAPEQLFGAEVDARADVFAFGAALYEALFSARPYPAATLAELEAALRRGVPREPPPSAKVPRWVRRAVLAALVGDRERRIGSMAELLERLRADPWRKALRVAVPFAVLSIIAVAVWLTWYAAGDAARTCRAGAERAAEMLTPERRHTAEAAFASAGSAVPEGALARVFQLLESHLGEWMIERVDACDDTYERREQSEQLLDLRLACLDQRLAETEALMAQLERADLDTAQRAQQAAAGLPPPGLCHEIERLRARVPPPTDPLSARLVRASQRLAAQATGAELAGKWKEGAFIARLAATLADGSGHAPARAEATAGLARLAMLAGEHVEAQALFPDAVAMGLAAGDDRIVAEAATGFGYLLALVSDDRDEARRWTSVAEAEIARLGGDEALTVQLLIARAMAHNQGGEAAKGLADLQRAAEIQERLHGVDDPTLVRTLDGLGGAQLQLERYGDCVATYRRGVALASQTLGRLHPDAMNIRSNEALCLASAGHYREALARLDELIPASRQFFGPQHWNTSIILLQRGMALIGLGRFDEAIAAGRESLAIAEKVFARQEGQLAYSHLIIAKAEVAAGRGEEALASADTALALTRRHAPDNRPLLAELSVVRALAIESAERWSEAAAAAEDAALEARASLGEGTQLALALGANARARVREGRPWEAVEIERQALAMLVARRDALSVERARGLVALGGALEETGAWAEAEAVLDEACAALEREPADPLLVAEARFSLARVTGDPEDIGRSEEIAASSPYPRGARLFQAIERWLADGAATP